MKESVSLSTESPNVEEINLEKKLVIKENNFQIYAWKMFKEIKRT